MRCARRASRRPRVARYYMIRAARLHHCIQTGWSSSCDRWLRCLRWPIRSVSRPGNHPVSLHDGQCLDERIAQKMHFVMRDEEISPRRQHFGQPWRPGHNLRWLPPLLDRLGRRPGQPSLEPDQAARPAAAADPKLCGGKPRRLLANDRPHPQANSVLLCQRQNRTHTAGW